jgi:hypothetical protein
MARSNKKLAFKQRNSELKIKIANDGPPELVRAVSQAKNQAISRLSSAVRKGISATKRTEDIGALLDAIYSLIPDELRAKYHISYMPRINIYNHAISIVWERTPSTTINSGKFFYLNPTVDHFTPAYSNHAVQRCIERTTAPLPFKALWDAYVRLFAASREITHEPWTTPTGRLLGFSVWEACHASIIGSRTAEILGFDPSTSKRVVGYCPAKMQRRFLAAATFLSPGHDGTPQECYRRNLTTAAFHKHGEEKFLAGVSRLHRVSPIVKAS